MREWAACGAVIPDRLLSTGVYLPDQARGRDRWGGARPYAVDTERSTVVVIPRAPPPPPNMGRLTWKAGKNSNIFALARGG